MDLSIVIVNWNTRALLHQCLRSIETYPPDVSYEVIVVDNGSKDGSLEMVRAHYPKVRLFEMSRNLGFARANNVGFGAAEGRYILMLNSDTLVHEGCLPRTVAHLARHKDVAAVGCRVLNGDGSHQPSAGLYPDFLYLLAQTVGIQRYRRHKRILSPTNRLAEVETISGCFLMIRARALREVGMLDEAFFFFGEETDWCCRARKAGFKLHYAPMGRITHFGGGSSAPLRFHRDLMLTNATVRLHLKHSNLTTARLIYYQLYLFNLSRAAYWGVSNFFLPSQSRAARANHFAAIVNRYEQAWPLNGDGLPGR